VKESEFQNQIVAGLESVGSKILNVHGHRFQKSGWPDLYVCGRWTGWIELKVGQGKPTPLQIIVIKDLLIRGVPAFVVRLRENVVYCELWYQGGMESLAYCREWNRRKGITRGLSLVEMFRGAGTLAIEMLKGVGNETK